jgi:hypothetical protein
LTLKGNPSFPEGHNSFRSVPGFKGKIKCPNQGLSCMRRPGKDNLLTNQKKVVEFKQIYNPRNYLMDAFALLNLG